MKGRILAARMDLMYKANGSRCTRNGANWLLEHDHAYKCYCTPDELSEMRKEQMAAKKTLGYDRRCRYLSAAQRAEKEAAGQTPVVRFKMPLEGVTVIPTSSVGISRSITARCRTRCS